MLSLSPAKILLVLVIMLIVLGPDKLPGMARQIGAAWHDFRTWRARLETEVRGTFPDLPPTHEVARAVRSPMAFLDRLADEHERTLGAETNGAAPTADTPSSPASPTAGGAGPAPPAGTGSGPPAVASNGRSARHGTGELSVAPGVVPDDPSMN